MQTLLVLCKSSSRSLYVRLLAYTHRQNTREQPVSDWFRRCDTRASVETVSETAHDTTTVLETPDVTHQHTQDKRLRVTAFLDCSSRPVAPSQGSDRCFARGIETRQLNDTATQLLHTWSTRVSSCQDKTHIMIQIIIIVQITTSAPSPVKNEDFQGRILLLGLMKTW